jgi:hypothetical protein
MGSSGGEHSLASAVRGSGIVDMTLARPAGANPHGTHVLVRWDVFFGSCAARSRLPSAGVLPLSEQRLLAQAIRRLVSPQLNLPRVGSLPSTARELHSIGVGCGWCRRGGIGTEQQGIELGFDRGEPFVLGIELLVLSLQPLDIVLDQLRSPLALLLSPLALEHTDPRVDCWMPIELRQKASPWRQGGEEFRFAD